MDAAEKRKARRLIPWVMILACAIVGAGLLAADGGKDEGETSHPKWQHLALTHQGGGDLAGGGLGRRINKLGQDGWELVSVESFTQSGTTTKTVFFFKKRL